jgi:PKD repeat protein
VPGGATPFTVIFSFTFKNAQSWQFDFGDGKLGAACSTACGTSFTLPPHDYTIVGQYLATLTLNSLNTTKQTIVVNANAE